MNQLNQINKKTVFYSLALLLAGLFLGWLLFKGGDQHSAAEQTGQAAGHVHEGEESSTTWTCSMHPQIREEGPGQCPICGMELIPVADLSAGEGEEDPMAVVMTEAAMKIAEVQTTTVERRAPYKEIYLPGKVKTDERNISDLTARFSGRIEKLYVNFTGQKVFKGQKLATVYSPELVTAQKELFEAIKLKKVAPELYQAAKNKLKLWDLTDAQINAIENRKEPRFYFDILSPLTGTVTERNVTIGDYVKEGSSLFVIEDLSRVWVMFDAYESDLPWIKKGSRINFTIQSLPGKTFSSRVTFIDPVINPDTRVARVRAELDNPGDVLKPDMFASGMLKTMLPGTQEALLIPKSSILWTGKRSVVYVKAPEKEQPTFHYREVVLGEDAGDAYVVNEGLSEGEEIVTNGVFKIDAAAQLQGKVSMMNPEGGKMPAGHQHGGMDLEEEPSSSAPGEDHSGHNSTDGAPKVDEQFKNQLNRVYEQYFQLKNALAADDPKKASRLSKAVSQTLEKVDMRLLQGQAHSQWMEQQDVLEKALKLIQTTDDIDAQRASFSKLSEALYTLAKSFDMKGLNAFYQYCPMANDNRGAYWLSEIRTIKNPYMGEQMLSCGENKETLN